MKKMLMASLLVLAFATTGLASTKHQPAKHADRPVAAVQQQGNNAKSADSNNTATVKHKRTHASVRRSVHKRSSAVKSGNTQGSRYNVRSSQTTESSHDTSAVQNGAKKQSTRSHKRMSKTTRTSTSRVDSTKVK